MLALCRNEKDLVDFSAFPLKSDGGSEKSQHSRGFISGQEHRLFR